MAVRRGGRGFYGYATSGAAQAGISQWRWYRRTRCWRTSVASNQGHSGPSSASTMDTEGPTPRARAATISSETFEATEESFVELVSQQWNNLPDIATTDSCCLVGFICTGTLFVANIGDSRVVLGRNIDSTGGIAAIQLSTEHNANVEAVRQELKSQHPNDPQIVVPRHGVWRIKGIIQGSARRLIKAALQEAARKREMRYSDLKRIDKIRHFLNHDQLAKGFAKVTTIS